MALFLLGCFVSGLIFAALLKDGIEKFVSGLHYSSMKLTICANIAFITCNGIMDSNHGKLTSYN